MAQPVMPVAPDKLMDQAVNLLIKRKAGGLPIINGGKLAGLIATIGMLRAVGDVAGTAEERVLRIELAFGGNAFDPARIAPLVGVSSGEVPAMRA